MIRSPTAGHYFVLNMVPVKAQTGQIPRTVGNIFRQIFGGWMDGWMENIDWKKVLVMQAFIMSSYTIIVKVSVFTSFAL